MPKVKLTVSMAGPAGAWGPGDFFECSAEEARRLVEAGFAVVSAETKVERAVPLNRAVETRDPLDHDGDGKKGGSLPGDNSTRAKGAKARK